MTFQAAPFQLTSDRVAKAPPEGRGLRRDEVRLMVTDSETGEITHTTFPELRKFLARGDLLVFNTSRTLPSSLQGYVAGSRTPIEVRLAEHLPDDSWYALLLCREGERFSCGLRTGLEIHLGDGFRAGVVGRHMSIPRLWKLRFSQTGSRLIDSIYRMGQPTRYEYLNKPWPIEFYQNVYAAEPGSAEMPSAGRAFSWKMINDLSRYGIETVRVLLHTGLSSYMDDELDNRKLIPEEQIRVTKDSALRLNRALRHGRRIIAVGTTSLRAIESASTARGEVRAYEGYTKLKIDRGYKLKVANGLLTGLHEPEASHLDILRAFLTEERIWTSYGEAKRLGYLWHEFGDLNLIAPTLRQNDHN